ncbi:hemagglutinin/amebocyte aggregation factor-like isoform X2 [Polyodon spathula]|uniref:hemagglutinin/amebocyte aggregation factor-like isoform X2 n=1 Tax=Polyodon spathula TaxID=7913 RepID=UPI001B7DA339|nr:hemagglutinin/amebocyte aggregation factor-like isoform X2 [Polyodon spathula]
MKKILFLVFAVLQVHCKAVDFTQETEADPQPSDKETLPERDLRCVNSYDQPFRFLCPMKQSIKTIKSVYNNDYGDRVWTFTCGATFYGYPTCSWSAYMNNFEQDFHYYCPGESFISGIHSYYENRYKDRRWQFYCCGMSGVSRRNCYWTNYVNQFDEAFLWAVPDKYYIAAVSSYFVSSYKDRRWSYLLCTK